MKTLVIWVTSYKRPHLLKDTLDSIAKMADVTHDVCVVDNSTSPETTSVIKSHPAVNFSYFLEENKGINWPLQNFLPGVLNHRYIMVCDHDLHFTRPFSLYTDFLDAHPEIAAAKGLDSPEHPKWGEIQYKDDTWLLKSTERGGGIVLRTADLLRYFPLKDRLLDFDTHIMDSIAPAKVAILPRGTIHVGYRESTWQGTTPERYILVDGVVREL